MAKWHIIALTYGCETCGAVPGQPCLTTSGRVKQTEVHTSRSNAAADNGWRAADDPGYVEGR